MKTRCVELSQFESELLIAFMNQPKDTPISAGLCRTIYRRLEGYKFAYVAHVDSVAVGIANLRSSRSNHNLFWI